MSALNDSSPDCIFCRIVAGDLPSELVYQDDSVVAFKDLNPQAPVHLLVVPRTHIRDVRELSADPGLLAAVTSRASALATQHSNGDFRLIFNTGAGAGQTVFHVHAHVLAGADQPEGAL